jgi:hypothetical protein
MAGKFKFKRASKITVPDEFFNPLKTGIREVDESWSEIGGIIPSQVTFITGPPGSGKTTLTLAIGSVLSSAKNIAFISLEMSDFQLAHQAKKIQGFGNVHVTADFDQEETFKALREMKPDLIILDSIQKAARKMRTPEGKTMPFNEAQFRIVDTFTKYAKDNWTPVFLIGHCDKSGNYKGPSDLLHDVDSHLNVKYDKEMDIRTFEFGKNRFGGVVAEEIFGINAEKVWIGSPFVQTVYPDAKVSRKEEPEDLKVKLNSCLADLSSSWNGSTAKILIKTAVEYLKEIEKDEFKDESIVGDIGKVKLSFRGNSVAHCHPNSGELVFGKKTFTKMKIGGIGYKKEQQFIQARMKNDGELLLWVVVHEWTHLFKGMGHHKLSFFEKVAEKYDRLIETLK